MESINLGILGTADVVNRSIIEPARLLPTVKVYAIASRDKEKAALFAQKHSIQNAFHSYESLLECKEINAVYIPLINSLHAEWVIKSAEAGKHVLVEKPICMKSSDITKIKDAVLANKVILLEGMMLQYHSWQKEIKQIIDQKTYGRLKTINVSANYILHEKNSFRLDGKLGGSVFWEEAGVWCQITAACLGNNPISFQGESDFSGPGGIDTRFSASLTFQGNIQSELRCSYSEPYEANVLFEFEQAHIKLKNYWKPTFGFNRLKFEIEHKKDEKTEFIEFSKSYYFFDQLKYFVDLIQGNQQNCYHSETFERIILMEKIYQKAQKDHLKQN